MNNLKQILLNKLFNNNLKEILTKKCIDQNEIESIQKGVINFANELKENKTDKFNFSFQNNIQNRKILTALQGIFGSFTSGNLSSEENYDNKAALIMLTNKTCTPFFMQILETFGKTFALEILKIQDQSLFELLMLRGNAVIEFLKNSGTFINIYQNDYSKFFNDSDFYQINQKIDEIKSKSCNHFYCEQSNEKLNFNGAFYITHQRNSLNPNENLVFILNAISSQVNDENQIPESKIIIKILNISALNNDELFSQISKITNSQKIDLKEILHLKDNQRADFYEQKSQKKHMVFENN